PAWLERVRRAARLDLRPGRPPSGIRWMLATLASVALALALDALAVHVATSEFPSTRHFSHFDFTDYGTLTVGGVLFGAVGWAAVSRLSSSAHWLLFRLAVIVSVVSWLPDVWILFEGETAKGVATLMVMHLVVAVVTYNLLVRVAPAGAPPAGAAAGAELPSLRLSERAVRRIWTAMGLVVALELALGVVVIVSVPFRRSAAILPVRDTGVYAAHGAVGIVLGLGAFAILVLSTVAGRIGRIGAVIGAAGVVLGLAGGVLSSFQETRLLGMAVMLVGVLVAGVGYMSPLLEAVGKAEVARAEAARTELGTRHETRSAPAPRPSPEVAGDGGASSNGHGARAG
ncbi:MAG: DUF6069 family protein, partial [Acidimicrobiales bacterium]